VHGRFLAVPPAHIDQVDFIARLFLLAGTDHGRASLPIVLNGLLGGLERCRRDFGDADVLAFLRGAFLREKGCGGEERQRLAPPGQPMARLWVPAARREVKQGLV
jgi:hypothetical protein